jgi:ubiquinone/menaquinone biosynthesis C-methylase UbiE
MIAEKLILDVCCGGRMFWFNKTHSSAIFGDIRRERHEFAGNRVVDIKPNLQMDFTNLPFQDNCFNLVVFDPPHIFHGGKNSWLVKKYGLLQSNWRDDLSKGFLECMRVLKPGGTLIFKWNETQVKTSDILRLVSFEPLFGHTTKNNGYTIWMTFMKQ